MTITVTNAEPISVMLTSLIIRAKEGAVVWQDTSPHIIPAQQKQAYDREVATYPSVDALKEVSAEATVTLPNGIAFSLPAEVLLAVDTLYSRGLDAQDLLEL